MTSVTISALKALYDSTNGMDWQWHGSGSRWNFTTPMPDPCGDLWEGICCPYTINSHQNNCSQIQEDYNFVPQHGFSNDSVIGIVLPDTNLKGRLPSELFALPNLTALILSYNELSHTLPNYMGGNLLKIFDVSWNELTGPFPPGLFGLSGIFSLNLNHNKFSHKIPNLADLPNTVKGLYLAGNSFSGTIPELPNTLKGLDLSFNGLSGPISTTIQDMKVLEFIYLENNYLSQSIPAWIGELTILESMILDNNVLTSTLPSVFSTMSNLTELLIAGNRFTQTLPHWIGSMTSLTDGLCIGNNYFSGTLPSALALLSDLQSLQVNNNLFQGQIPAELSEMYALRTLLLGSNQFTGNVEAVFSPLQANLSTIDISNNALRGQLPRSMFNLSSISTVAMIKNCFTGSISDHICKSHGAKSLKVLAMDGLTTGDTCEYPLVFGSYTISTYIDGSIPNCLFQLPNIVVLQLSGNGLSGSLPSASDAPMSKSLRNISISHNRLVGTIPDQFQTHDFDTLVMSYNRLSGTITGMGAFFDDATDDIDKYNHQVTLPVSHQLTLAVNRLSGTLPSSFYLAQNVDLVDGNMFGCSKFDVGLPLNDPGTKTHFCGSYGLDITLIVCVCCTGVTGMLIWLRLYRSSVKAAQEQKRTSARIQLQHKLILSPPPPLTNREENSISSINSSTVVTHFGLELIDSVYHWLFRSWEELIGSPMLTALNTTKSFLQFLSLLEKLALLCTCAVWLIFFPMEMTLKYQNGSQYSTHTFQYAYAPSLAFITGEVAGIVLLFVVALFVCTVYYLLTWRSHWTYWGNSPRPAGAYSPSLRSLFMSLRFENIWQATKLLGVLGGFSAFDVSVMLLANGTYLYVILYQDYNFAVAALVILVVFKILWNMWMLPYCLLRLQHYFDDVYQISSGLLLACLMIFNNIVVPIITTLCADPNCFQSVFVTADQVDVQFEYIDNCFVSAELVEATRCLAVPQVVHLSYNPPFIYSYQCSSSIMTYYIPVFMCMYIYLAFISPFLTYLATYCYSRQDVSKTVKYLLDFIGYGIMKHKNEIMEDIARNSMADNVTMLVNNKGNLDCFLSAKMVSAAMVCHITTLLTFGAVYPLLAVLICMAICVESTQWRLLVTRFLKQCHDACNSAEERMVMLELLQFSCSGIRGLIGKSKWLIVFTMSLFFSSFVFDMIGNQVDIWINLLWAPFALVMLPLLLWVLEMTVLRASVAATKRPMTSPLSSSSAADREARSLSGDSSLADSFAAPQSHAPFRVEQFNSNFVTSSVC